MTVKGSPDKGALGAVEVGCDAVCNDSLLERERDVVISGVSCRLPKSENMAEFHEHLTHGTDMIGSEAVNAFGGSLKNLDKFDASYFGIPAQEANRMDPQLRMLLELTAEALIDAGIDPHHGKETNTAVYVGMNISHAHESWSTDPDQPQGDAALGCAKNRMANRISCSFNFTGPSYSIQASDAAGSVALERAYQSVSEGETDAAVVAGTSLCLKHTTANLKDTHACRHPIIDECGCYGSDGVVVMFLQRYPKAKRVYATIVHSNAQISPPTMRAHCIQNNSGMHYPKYENQVLLLQDTYTEANVEPESVEYVETHACGLCESDQAEISSLSTVLSSDRDISLLIGSVKSSVGHLDAASGLVSVARVLLAMEDGMISPSHHFDTQAVLIPGSMEVVKENMRTLDTYMGVNSLGHGGYHVHTILKPNDKKRLLLYCLCDKMRLCVYSGATEKGLRKVFKFMKKHSLDMELHALLNETATMSPSSLAYRGYCILNKKDGEINIQICPNVKERRPVWFVFSGIGSQWPGMGRSLMSSDTFRSSILESSDTLKKYGLNLYKMMTAGQDDVYEKPINSFIGITAIQIALVQLLQQIGVEPDGILGHSVGEIACGYTDGSLTAEEAILAAYWRGFSIQQADLTSGLMAAVGLTWQEAASQCPPGVVPACHNSLDTVTISGTVDKVQPFLAELRERQVFVRELNTAGVAFHSPNMQEVVPVFKEYLTKLVVPKKRSQRWVSTSIPEARWSTDLASHCSVDYLVNNLTSPVLFQEALQHIQDNAIVVEIGPHCLLQPILRRSLAKSAFHTGLLNKDSLDSASELFSSLGKCYLNGMDLDPLAIFPPVKFPVSRGTPMISPLISWDHSQSWDLPDPAQFLSAGSRSNPQSTFVIDPRPEGLHHHMTGHVINGRPVFPAAGYILLAWKTLATYCGEVHENLPVCLEKVIIHRHTLLSATDRVTFDVSINARDEFEIVDGDELVCSGTISERSRFMVIPDNTEAQSPVSPRRQDIQLTHTEVYKEFGLRGLEYSTDFQPVIKSDSTGEHGLLKWTGDWVTFLEGMLQMVMLSEPGTSLCLSGQIGSVMINPVKHIERIWKLPSDETVSTVTVNKHANTVISGDVAIHGLMFNSLIQNPHQPVLTQQSVFIPYIQKGKDLLPCNQTLSWYADDCKQLALQSLRSVWDSLNTVGGLQLLHNKSDLEKLLHNQSEDKFAIVGEVDMRNYSNCENCGIVNLLEKIEALPAVENFLENLRNLFDAYEKDILSDQMLIRSVSSDFVKPCLDVICENSSSDTLRLLEMVGHNVQSAYNEIITNMSSNLHLRLDYSVSGLKEAGETVKVLKWSLSEEVDPGMKSFDALMLNNVLSMCPNITKALRNAIAAVSDNGFILVEEPTFNLPIAFVLHGFTENWNHIEDKEIRDTGRWLSQDAWIELFESVGLKLVSTRTTGHYCSLFLLRKPSSSMVLQENQTVVDVSKLDRDGLKKLQQTLTEAEGREPARNVWLVAENQPYSGVMGLVKNAIKKAGRHKIRCLLLEDTYPDMSVKSLKGSGVFRDLVSKDLLMNVYKGGEWGSYRRMPLNIGKTNQIVTDSSCVHAMDKPVEPVWVTSPVCFPSNTDLNIDMVLCYPRYGSVTSKEVAVLKGVYSPKNERKNKGQVECLGTEFSGFDDKGHKVMGIATAGALSTKVYVDRHRMWPVPEGWSLQQACTVPLSYSAAYYGLVCCANIQATKSVLIIGSNQTSLAAINVALSQKCQVLVAMETEESVSFVVEKYGDKLKTFLLEDSYFFIDVKRKTKMRGVDVIFDCLMDEKLLRYSTTCLRPGGFFIQCPHYGTMPATDGVKLLSSYCTVSCLQLDNLDPDDRDTISHLITTGIQTGLIQPFEASVFKKDQLKSAFEAKQTTENCVLIKITDDTSVGPAKILARQRLLLDPQKCYIINGGLGDLGLELGQWMVDHGANKLLLNGSTEIKTGYQAKRQRQWQMEGVIVTLSSRDITSLEETRELIKEAKKLGPVGGVFHVTKEDELTNQATSELVDRVLASKVTATLNLDEETRSSCSRTLEYFVTFSTMMTGLDEEAERLYGYADSAMERVCQKRHKEGLPGISVQWGPVEDVGLASDMVPRKAGSLPGPIPQTVGSCSKLLEGILMQSKPSVSCIIPAYTYTSDRAGSSEAGHKSSLLQAVCSISGVQDVKQLRKDTRLLDLGMDTLMATEIQQILKKQQGLFLAAEEVSQLTLQQIENLSLTDKMEINQQDMCPQQLECVQGSQLPDHWLSSEPVVKLNQVENDKLPIFLVIDEDSMAELQTLVPMLDCPVYGIHCSDNVHFFSVPTLAAFLLQQLFIVNNSKPLILGGHKFGCVVAMEMALQLQENEAIPVQHVICLEGSQSYVSLADTCHLMVEEVCSMSEDSQISEALRVFVEMYTQLDNQLLKIIDEVETEKVSIATAILASCMKETTSLDMSEKQLQRKMMIFINKYLQVGKYRPGRKCLGDVTLIRGRQHSKDIKIAGDYNLSEVCSGQVLVHILNNQHEGLLEAMRDDVAATINATHNKVSEKSQSK